MKVFITGATGFIGKHLTRRLVADGHEVTCLARKTSQTGELRNMGVRIVCGDVNDREALREGMAGCAWLFHLGNVYSMWEPDPRIFDRVNVDGTRAVLEGALKAGIQKVIYVSTVAVYGKPAQQPFNEDCPPGPCLFSAYARSKAAAERFAWDFSHQTSLPLVVLYPGIVLGAGDDKASGQYIRGLVTRHLPSTIFHQAKATYVAVEDVVEALVRAAELPRTVGQKYLLGKEILSGRAFTEMIQTTSGVKLPFFRLPDWMVTAAAYLFTAVSKLVRRPPLWGLSIDAARTLKNGFIIDGSKAERELGIRYHPIVGALKAAIATYLRDVPSAQDGSLEYYTRRTASASLRVLDKEVVQNDRA